MLDVDPSSRPSLFVLPTYFRYPTFIFYSPHWGPNIRSAWQGRNADSLREFDDKCICE